MSYVNILVVFCYILQTISAQQPFATLSEYYASDCNEDSDIDYIQIQSSTSQTCYNWQNDVNILSINLDCTSGVLSTYSSLSCTGTATTYNANNLRCSALGHNYVTVVCNQQSVTDVATVYFGPTQPVTGNGFVTFQAAECLTTPSGGYCVVNINTLGITSNTNCQSWRDGVSISLIVKIPVPMQTYMWYSPTSVSTCTGGLGTENLLQLFYSQYLSSTTYCYDGVGYVFGQAAEVCFSPSVVTLPAPTTIYVPTLSVVTGKVQNLIFQQPLEVDTTQLNYAITPPVSLTSINAAAVAIAWGDGTCVLLLVGGPVYTGVLSATSLGSSPLVWGISTAEWNTITLNTPPIYHLNVQCTQVVGSSGYAYREMIAGVSGQSQSVCDYSVTSCNVYAPLHFFQYCTSISGNLLQDFWCYNSSFTANDFTATTVVILLNSTSCLFIPCPPYTPDRPIQLYYTSQPIDLFYTGMLTPGSTCDYTHVTSAVSVWQGISGNCIATGFPALPFAEVTCGSSSSYVTFFASSSAQGGFYSCGSAVTGAVSASSCTTATINSISYSFTITCGPNSFYSYSPADAVVSTSLTLNEEPVSALQINAFGVLECTQSSVANADYYFQGVCFANGAYVFYILQANSHVEDVFVQCNDKILVAVTSGFGYNTVSSPGFQISVDCPFIGPFLKSDYLIDPNLLYTATILKPQYGCLTGQNMNLTRMIQTTSGVSGQCNSFASDGITVNSAVITCTGQVTADVYLFSDNACQNKLDSSVIQQNECISMLSGNFHMNVSCSYTSGTVTAIQSFSGNIQTVVADYDTPCQTNPNTTVSFQALNGNCVNINGHPLIGGVEVLCYNATSYNLLLYNLSGCASQQPTFTLIGNSQQCYEVQTHALQYSEGYTFFITCSSESLLPSSAGSSSSSGSVFGLSIPDSVIWGLIYTAIAIGGLMALCCVISVFQSLSSSSSSTTTQNINEREIEKHNLLDKN